MQPYDQRNQWASGSVTAAGEHSPPPPPRPPNKSDARHCQQRPHPPCTETARAQLSLTIVVGVAHKMHIENIVAVLGGGAISSHTRH
jgi:hypothetical protein